MHASQLKLRELELRRLHVLQQPFSDGRLAEIEAEIAEIERDTRSLVHLQQQLSTELGQAIASRHQSFHPVWGQLFKAGHQNSRWAQQVQPQTATDSNRQ